MELALGLKFESGREFVVRITEREMVAALVRKQWPQELAEQAIKDIREGLTEKARKSL